MNILLDTDILIDAGMDRKPFSDNACRILDLAQQRKFSAHIAWHSISNFHYIVTALSKNDSSRRFLAELLEFVSIAPTTTYHAKHALKMTMTDFEDAMQVSAAEACRAEYIITRNTAHFRKSIIPALLPGHFLSEKMHLR